MKIKNGKSIQQAVADFRKNGGLLNTAKALKLGIHPRTLYAMRDKGVLERLSRELYRSSDLAPLGNPDLVTVVVRIPEGVICLISALAYHEITTQIARKVHVAIRRNAEPPRIDYPSVHAYRFSGKAFTEGVETHERDGIPAKVYKLEKTLADCFKYRNKIGMDTAIEAVRLYRERKKVQVGEICALQKSAA